MGSNEQAPPGGIIGALDRIDEALSRIEEKAERNYRETVELSRSMNANLDKLIGLAKEIRRGRAA